jgi:hypothetical protein
MVMHDCPKWVWSTQTWARSGHFYTRSDLRALNVFPLLSRPLSGELGNYARSLLLAWTIAGCNRSLGPSTRTIPLHQDTHTHTLQGRRKQLRGGKAGPGGGVAAPLVRMRTSRSSILVMVAMVNYVVQWLDHGFYSAEGTHGSICPAK